SVTQASPSTSHADLSASHADLSASPAGPAFGQALYFPPPRFAPAPALFAQKLADNGCLARFLEQEAVVAVRRLDHMELDRLAERAKGAFDLPRRRRRVQPVGAERDQQRPRRNAFERSRERSAAMLPGKVEIRQGARRIDIGIGVEPPDERAGLVAQ